MKFLCISALLCCFSAALATDEDLNNLLAIIKQTAIAAGEQQDASGVIADVTKTFDKQVLPRDNPNAFIDPVAWGNLEGCEAK